jgi:hypothetical protein
MKKGIPTRLLPIQTMVLGTILREIEEDSTMTSVLWTRKFVPKRWIEVDRCEDSYNEIRSTTPRFPSHEISRLLGFSEDGIMELQSCLNSAGSDR